MKASYLSKKLYAIASFLFLAGMLQAQTSAYVRGTVKYPNGEPVVGHAVTMAVGTTAAATCQMNTSVVTNAQGVFENTVRCNVALQFVVVSVKNCNGLVLSQTLPMTNTGHIEAHFTICRKVECKAAIKWIHAPVSSTAGFGILFSSAGSTVMAGDEIVERTWHFGDGTTLKSNSPEIRHAYREPGVYEVCLVIKTRLGCESKVCARVVVERKVECKAVIRWDVATPSNTAAGYIVHFTSHGSQVINADEIVERTWHFGDGTVVKGNEEKIRHNYREPGVYEACLVIKTRLGCESKVCARVVVERKVECKAVIRWDVAPPVNSTSGNNVYFTSHGSQIIDADEIVKRIWHFGDGTVAEGNEEKIRHTYREPGIYEVCLVIKTRLGCESKVCARVVVERRVECKAAFKWTRAPLANTLAGYTIYFSSEGSSVMDGDEIVERKWHLGNGTVIGGNAAEIKHTYREPGVYEVCLLIKTKKGCESKICERVVIEPRVKCEALFRFETGDAGKVFFNSANAVVMAGDDIVARRWDFGNGKKLDGNVIRPTMEYAHPGRYTVCLSIKTRNGCESKICQVVEVKPRHPGTDNQRLQIVRLFPNPVGPMMTVALFSPKDEVKASLVIADVNGNIKWSNRITVAKGTTTHTIQTSFLPPGAYILKLTSEYGVQSKTFYKLN